MAIEIVNPSNVLPEDKSDADSLSAGALASRTRGKPRGATGPATAAGKAIAARNATRHGIFAAHLVEGVETAADWETHHAGPLDSLAPETALEHELADCAALLLWRLRRVTRFEANAISSHVARAGTNVAAKLDEALRDTHPSYQDLYRFQYLTDDPAALRHAHQDLAAAIAALESLPTLRDRDDAPIPDAERTVLPMLRAVARAANKPDEGDRFRDVSSPKRTIGRRAPSAIASRPPLGD